MAGSTDTADAFAYMAEAMRRRGMFAEDTVHVRRPQAPPPRVEIAHLPHLGPGHWSVAIDGRVLLDEFGEQADVSPNYRAERWTNVHSAMSHFYRVAENFDKIRRLL